MATLYNEKTLHDSRPLMKLIAGLANLDAAKCRRLTLVLEPSAAPVLYVETYLQEHRADLVSEGELAAAAEDAGGLNPVIVPILGKGY